MFENYSNRIGSRNGKKYPFTAGIVKHQLRCCVKLLVLEMLIIFIHFY